MNKGDWLSRLVVALLAVTVVSVSAQTNYPRTGWETILTQTGHGVSGTATILNERTIRLTRFSYDGLAPDMYVYLSTNLTSAAFLESGLTISPRLTRAYTNETYDVQLPLGQTLDGWSAISIWCRAVRASFGWGTFAPAVHPTLSVARQADALEVRVSGEAGRTYRLLSSANIFDTNAWQVIALLPNLTGTAVYTIPVTNGPARFFRAVRD
jgi:electron transfer DM13